MTGEGREGGHKFTTSLEYFLFSLQALGMSMG